ncbi:dihydroorotate dehydrogenase (fumarate) [uncultured Gammaproteobacteria bacterium]
MDLATRYLGLALAHPLMAGASPLADDLDGVRRLEDAGASAIVLRSLFEEQILGDRSQVLDNAERTGDSSPEAQSYFPRMDDYALGPEAYLEHIRRIKASVHLPLIASLNGVTAGGWTDHAQMIEQAGADALELNVYFVAADASESAQKVEERLFDIAGRVRAAVRIPVAIKLSPYFSSLANIAHRLAGIGVNGLILFNRFYQPDIDIEQLETVSKLELSTSAELLLRLRWLAVLSGRLPASLAVSGGVHTVADVVKAIMAGADAVQMVSALLLRSPSHLTELRDGLSQWLEEHEYQSLAQMRGSMNLSRCPDPAAYERANYMHVLNTWTRRR